MSSTRKSNLKKSPSKTEKKRVRISSEPNILIFDRVSPDKTPQSNPSRSKSFIVETERELDEQRRRDALALDNKYKNSAYIKDRKTHRRVTVREANAHSPYEIADESRISIPRTKTGFSAAAVVRSPESVITLDPIKPPKTPTFLSRVFNRAKSLISRKKTAGKHRANTRKIKR
jgi:hypothetical protein